jgi:hypothetical protein
MINNTPPANSVKAKAPTNTGTAAATTATNTNTTAVPNARPTTAAVAAKPATPASSVQSASAGTGASTAAGPGATTTGQGATTAARIPIPSAKTLEAAVRLSITDDRPIIMDYWTASLNKQALIGVRENGDKQLLKSAEEYTSLIVKLYKSENEYIVMTENSIYLVSSSISSRTVSGGLND